MRELPGGRSKDFAFSLILDLYEIEAKYTAELYDGIGLTEGGVWRFDMVAADGTRYSNRMTFLILDRPHRIEVEHGAVRDDDPGRFRMLVTFDAQSDGKTVLTLRQMHPSRGSGRRPSASARSNTARRRSTSSPGTSPRARQGQARD